MRTASWLVLALLAGCGSGSSPAPDAGGASCIVAGSDHFCSADHGCCAGAFCDGVTGYCRDSAACGVSGQACGGDGVPACCEGLECEQGRCEPTVQGTATTGGGNSTNVGQTSSGSSASANSTATGNTLTSDSNNTTSNNSNTGSGTFNAAGAR